MREDGKRLRVGSGFVNRSVALVTGASRGIGRACAVGLAEAGFAVGLVARGRDALEETARMVGEDSLVVCADVSKPEDAERAVGEVVAKFGRLDCVVNVAGVAPVRAIAEMTVAEWRETVETNLSAVFYVMRGAWPHLKKGADRLEGTSSIINISSLASRDPFGGFGAYGAAKAGVNILGLVAAREGQVDGIAVHTIAPGAVETGMFRKIISAEEYPTEKTLSPEEVARVVVRCANGELRHTSGEVIYLHKTV